MPLDALEQQEIRALVTVPGFRRLGNALLDSDNYIRTSGKINILAVSRKTGIPQDRVVKQLAVIKEKLENEGY